jgi:competence protein ComEA
MVAGAVAMMLVLFFTRGRLAGKQSGLTALSAPLHTGVTVQVSGDVVHPGIYEVIDKKMTIDVIKMAIPRCVEPAITDDSLLSARLHAGDALQITCKAKNDKALVTHSRIQSSQSLTLGIPLDLNKISEADLVLLPGIGPAMARRIIEYRHKNGGYSSLEELLQVDGIGEKKFQQLSHYLTIRY